MLNVPYGSVFVPTIGGGHFRAEFHYLLKPGSPTLDKREGKGSCLLFFSVDRENLTIDYEIDKCTHKNIFPETVPGKMRVADEGTWVDEKTGQTMVVASVEGRLLY